MSKYLYLNTQRLKEMKDILKLNEGIFDNEGQEAEFNRVNFSLDKDIVDGIKAHKEIKAKIACIKAEVARMRAYQAEEELILASLEKRLRFALESKGEKKLTYGLHSLSFRKIPDTLPEEILEDKVPMIEEFWEIIPSSKKMKRRFVFQAVKDGRIEDIELVTGRFSLVIK